MGDTANLGSASHADPVDKNVYLEDDPHRAALEDNPEVPEKLTWSTVLSIFVSELSPLTSPAGFEH